MLQTEFIVYLYFFGFYYINEVFNFSNHVFFLSEPLLRQPFDGWQSVIFAQSGAKCSEEGRNWPSPNRECNEAQANAVVAKTGVETAAGG